MTRLVCCQMLRPTAQSANYAWHFGRYLVSKLVMLVLRRRHPFHCTQFMTVTMRSSAHAGLCDFAACCLHKPLASSWFICVQGFYFSANEGADPISQLWGEIQRVFTLACGEACPLIQLDAESVRAELPTTPHDLANMVRWHSRLVVAQSSYTDSGAWHC
jgi:hypothetical protein